MERLREIWERLSPRGRIGAVSGAVGIAILVVVLLGVALFGSDDADEAAPPTTRRATTTTTSTPVVVTTTTEPPTGPVAPLTGLRVGDPKLVQRPVLAVKIDNLDTPGESAVPQTGLKKADVVFEEIVEGNITRLVGIFHSQDPGTVGPVRSARTTDLMILPQFGKALLAWSGGNEGVTAAVHASPAIVDVGANAASSAFHRDGSRRAPHNLYVDATSLWGRAPAGLAPPNPMFGYRRPGQKLPKIAKKSAGVDIVWGGGASAPVSWRWDPKTRLYIRSQRGRVHLDSDGTPLTAKNVVVQVTEYGQSPADLRSPEAHTIGGGELFVYTNGRVVHGKWVRPDPTKSALLVDDEDHIVKLSPGQTWIELPRAGNARTVD